MKALDQIAERMVALIRKDGWFDQCVEATWKFIAMPRREYRPPVEPKKEQLKR
jgi:hypothetical protein